MLKFHTNDTTLLATFEDFITTVFVMIDDLYRRYAPPEVAKRRHALDAKLSDSEIITVSICGELAGIDSENAWYSFVKRNYQHSVFAASSGRFCIVDSFSLAVCKFGRARYCHTFRGLGADYGKCPSKKETYFGYKVHAMVTLEGYVTAFEVTPASTDDREGLHDLVDGQSGLVVLGDKGYTGGALADDLSRQGIYLMALKRSNSRTDWPRHMRQLIFRLRRRVETVFSQLSGQLNAERVLARSFQGVCTRLANKILAYNLCMTLNNIFGEDYELARIKKFVF